MPRILLVAVLVVGALAARAAAQDPGESRARELYQQGLDHYQNKQYPLAVEAFKEAYALKNAPRLLFNIAQAYRLSGDCRAALDYYRQYLDVDPRSEHVREVKDRIQEMEACADKAGPSPPEPTPAPSPPPPSAPPVAAPVASPASGTVAEAGPKKRLAGVITGGAGLLLVATGTVFALQAARAADDVDRRFQEGGPWTQEFRDLEARGQRDQTLAIVLSATGAAAVATGALLYYWGWRDDLSMTLTSGGASVTWGGTF